MGLDILIETKNTKLRKTCYFSRQFCREMISQVEDESSIINQLIEECKVKKVIIVKMNIWDLEKDFNSLLSKFSKKKIESRYKNAWQKSDKVLEEFKRLRNCIKSDDKVLKNLKISDETQKKYYRETRFLKKNEKGQKSFMLDLETMIKFLEELPENEVVKFHYF